MAEGGAEAASWLGRFSWAMFKWANQPVFTVITTFIFAPYFTSAVVGDPIQGKHANVLETLGQNLKTAPVIGMRMRENDPIDGLAERLHV